MNDYILQEISSMLSSILSEIKWLSFIFAIILIIVALNEFKATEDKITDYGRQCQQSGVSVQNCKSWTVFKTTYILNKATNEVGFYDGSGDAGRKNCHIYDSENWYCDLFEGTALEGNGGNVIGFANGKSIENDPSSQTYIEQHFGLITYWWYKSLSYLHL